MKGKKIVVFLMAVCMLFVYSSQSYALGPGNTINRSDIPKCMFDEELLSSDTTKDDKGRFQTGYFYYDSFSLASDFNTLRMKVYGSENGFFYITREEVTSVETTEGIKAYQYKVWCNSSFIEMPIDGRYDGVDLDSATSGVHKTYERTSPVYGYMIISNLYFIMDENFTEKDYKETISAYSTNLPVFDIGDTEAINAYINSGNYSGAINSDDIDTPPVEYDELVEKPKNLRTYGNVENVLGTYDKSGQITVRWDVPQNQINSYSYDVQVRSCYIYGGKPTWTSWNTKVSDYPYNGRDLYDLTTGEKVDRSPTLPEDFIVTQKILYENVPSVPDNLITGATRYAISDFEVRVRNRSGGRCSNWVSTKVSADNKHIATVTDDDGNVVDDEDYNGQDVNNSNQDTYYDTDHQDGGTDGVVNTDNVSISSILGFIKSGFGLLGDNGIIALMSKTYLYLPASIWTIIKFFVAMLVVIAIIGAIKEVL